MNTDLLINILVLLLIGSASYLIGFRVHDVLKKRNFRRPRLMGFIAFACSYTIILAIIIYIVIHNINFRR